MNSRDIRAPMRGPLLLLVGAVLALVLVVLGVVLWTYFRPVEIDYGESDLVFVNCSDAQIASVVLRGDTFEQGSQNADNSPLRRGESFGFEVDGYPVTVTVHSGLTGQGAPLATCTVETAPAEGERWYVAARDSGGGILLEVGSQWPEDEQERSREVLQALSGALAPWIYLWVPLALLVGMALVCLVRLPREQRRGLLTATAVVGCAAAILFGGVWLMRGHGLSWRTVPLEVLCALTWLSGLTAGVLTVRYLPRLVRRHAPRLAVWAQAAALYCLLSVMLIGSFLGLLWAAFIQNGGGETVGIYEGQKVVQVEFTWVGDTSYSIHAYHGPLVRGTEALESSIEPFFEENAEVKSAGQAAEQFHRQEEDFQQAARQALAQSSADGVELPWGVKDITLWDNAQGRCVEFYMGGAGFGSSTAYWGVIYTTGTGPVGFQGDVQDYVRDGEGWSWQETGGDNWSYVLPLAPHWYAYEMHF